MRPAGRCGCEAGRGCAAGARRADAAQDHHLEPGAAPGACCAGAALGHAALPWRWSLYASGRPVIRPARLRDVHMPRLLRGRDEERAGPADEGADAARCPNTDGGRRGALCAVLGCAVLGCAMDTAPSQWPQWTLRTLDGDPADARAGRGLRVDVGDVARRRARMTTRCRRVPSRGQTRGVAPASWTVRGGRRGRRRCAGDKALRGPHAWPAPRLRGARRACVGHESIAGHAAPPPYHRRAG